MQGTWRIVMRVLPALPFLVQLTLAIMTCVADGVPAIRPS